LRQADVDPQLYRGARVERRVARNGMVLPFGLGAQVALDMAQGFAVSQLRDGHCYELANVGEVLDLEVGYRFDML